MRLNAIGLLRVKLVQCAGEGREGLSLSETRQSLGCALPSLSGLASARIAEGRRVATQTSLARFSFPSPLHLVGGGERCSGAFPGHKARSRAQQRGKPALWARLCAQSIYLTSTDGGPGRLRPGAAQAWRCVDAHTEPRAPLLTPGARAGLAGGDTGGQQRYRGGVSAGGE